jgi:hypothetical protein
VQQVEQGGGIGSTRDAHQNPVMGLNQCVGSNKGKNLLEERSGHHIVAIRLTRDKVRRRTQFQQSV